MGAEIFFLKRVREHNTYNNLAIFDGTAWGSLFARELDWFTGYRFCDADYWICYQAGWNNFIVFRHDWVCGFDC
jgi:hypothetical protein